MNPNPSETKRRWIALTLVVGAFTVALVVWLRWPSQNTPAEPSVDVKPSSRGWQIRYNATLALLVKGSKHIPFKEVLEMLDENQQLRNFRVKQENGQEVADETGARKTILNALKAIADWAKKRGNDYGMDVKKWQKVIAAVQNLAENSPNAVVKKEAMVTQEALAKKG
jgi:hypothetical protein